jgi:hypothetical protein
MPRDTEAEASLRLRKVLIGKPKAFRTAGGKAAKSFPAAPFDCAFASGRC